jgi:hypothetical protein
MSRTDKEQILQQRRRGVVTAEYLLLVTLIGIGVLVGLAVLRNAIVAELQDCADAVQAIIP